MTWHFSAQGHITNVLKASPGGGGCKVLEEETCFSHVCCAHLSHQVLSSFSSNSSRLPKALDRKALANCKAPGSQWQKLPQCVSPWHVLLLLGICGDREWPQRLSLLWTEVADTGFLENEEKHILHRCRHQWSPNLPLGIEYTGPWQLALEQTSFLTGCHQQASQFSPLPSRRDGQGGRKQRTAALKTTEWVHLRLAQGHKLLWTFRQSLLNRPARFFYDAELLCRITPPSWDTPMLVTLVFIETVDSCPPVLSLVFTLSTDHLSSIRYGFPSPLYTSWFEL